MVNLTEILAKTVEKDGKTLGTAEKLLFDNFARVCLLQIDGEIYGVDKATPRPGKVMVAARPFEDEQLTKLHRRGQFMHALTVGQQILDQCGHIIGEVADVELNSKLIVRQLLSDGGRYFKRGEIVAVGDAVIVKSKSAKQLVLDEMRKEMVLNKLQSPSKQRVTTEKEVPHTATPPKTETVQVATQPKAETAAAKPATVTATTTSHTIRRKYGDFNFLIGKSVDKTITNFQGEVMIKQHETINAEVLRQAKISGKLLELYLHIK